MSGENRSSDYRKPAARIVCGGILLAGLAAGSHWHRAAKPGVAPPLETTLTLIASAVRPSSTLASSPLASPPLAISHRAKGTSAPESSASELRSDAAPPPTLSLIARAQAVKTYGALPMMFEANNGQTDPRVKFLSRAPGYALLLTDKEAVLSLPAGSPASAPAHGAQHSRSFPSSHLEEPEAPKLTRVVRLKFAGGNTPTAVAGRDQLPGKTNYFLGNDPKQWHTNVPNYSAVEYRGIYSGVDAVFHGDNRRLEFDFNIAPGADPNLIALKIEGARRIRLNQAGDVLLGIDATRDVVMGKPHIYQQSPEGRREIAGHYVLGARNRIAFALGPYDHAQRLVIDPTLAYSTYLGGSSYDYAEAIAVDSSGNAYVTGFTSSTDFPITADAYQTTCPSCSGQYSGVAFVAKLNPAGSALVYSTYLSGAALFGIAIDSSGNAYVAGSSGTGFPTVNPYQATNHGTSNAVVAKLNATGSALIYSTYLGGDYFDEAFGIAVDSFGNAYVTGITNSTGFPTVNPIQATCNACAGSASLFDGDAFVTEFNAAGSALVYSTYLGGSAQDVGQAIAVNSSGNAYVTGYTQSTNFPTAIPFQASNGSSILSTTGANAFVTKLNSGGSALVYSTYLGGSAEDLGLGIAVDFSGSAYVTGFAQSRNFPTSNAFQATMHGVNDAFVTKFNPEGSDLVYSSYLGGISADQGNSIAVDASDNAYVTGSTASTNFPLVDPTQTTCGSCSSYNEAFVAKVNPAGSALVFSTYLGGGNNSAGAGIGVDSAGNAYVAGRTASPNFPTVNPLQAANENSNGTAFIAKYSFSESTTLTISPATIPSGTAGVLYSPVTFTATGGQGTVTISESGSLPSGMTFSNGTLSGTPMLTGSYPIIITAADSQGDAESENLILTINCPTITVGPSALANGMVGAAYPAVTFTETGGVGTVTFSATGLPTPGIGMTFAAGVLSGTPTTSESFPITVNATDSNSCSGNITDTLTINSSTITPAYVTDNETITVTDTPTFPDVPDSEKITVTDGVTVTPLISVTAPVASFSTSSLGFGSVAAGSMGTQTITVSNIGEGQTGLALSSAVISPSGTPFAVGTISCSNGVTSFSTTLPSGGACLVMISYIAPASGTPPSATITFTDNAALSNLTSRSAGGSNYTQSIALNGSGTTAPQPTEPPATVPVSDNETITVTDTPTFPDVADSETITVTDQVSITVSQTITFGTAPTVVVGGSGMLSATASSGLPVTFSSTTPAICGVAGSTVTGLAVGSCIVAANQPGNTNYSPAPQVTQTISISASSGLSPATLTFGDQLVGSTSATQTVTLTNAGTAKLTVGAITTTPDFTHPSKTCTATLAAGSSCTISVAFAPKSTGSVTGTLTVGTNGTVALSGTGIVPSASIAPATYTFKNQQVDTTSAVQTFTYTNTGLVSITVSSVTLTGAAATNYVVASDPCTGVTLAAGAACDVGVTFTPSVANNRVATLKVTDETGGAAKATASLSGTGVAPSASLTGNATFGSQQVGVTSPAQMLTYQNTGLGAISVNSAALSGNAATDYVIATDTCSGSTLAASASCSIGLTFTPSEVGSRAASLTVTDSTGGAKAQSLSLSGTGVAPTISLGSAPFAYGAVTVATAATFTLTNSGTAPLVISTIALTTGTQFKVTGGTCAVGGVVSNGSSCTVIVTFTPSGKTTFTDTLTVQGTGVGTGAPTYTASRAMTGH